MVTKATILAVFVSFALGALLGRYSLPAKVITKTETVTLRDSNKIDHSVTTVTTEKHKDGTETVVAVTHNDIDTVSHSASDSKAEKDIVYDTKRWGINALMAYPGLHSTPTYGVSVTYRLLGPLSIGALGLSNGTLGMSVGVVF